MTFTEKERKWFHRWFRPYSREEQIKNARERIVVYIILYLGFALYAFYSSTLDPEDMLRFEGEVESVRMGSYSTGRGNFPQLLIKLKHRNDLIPYHRGGYETLTKLHTRIARAKWIKLYLSNQALGTVLSRSSPAEPTYLEIDGKVVLSLDEWKQSNYSLIWMLIGTGALFVGMATLVAKAEAITEWWDKWTNKGKPESLVDVYVQKFRDYSRERLAEIAEGENRQPEAREGARRLLEEDSSVR